MPRQIFLVPSEPDPTHLRRSIENPFSSDLHRHIDPQTLRDLKQRSTDGQIYAWGSISDKTWKNLQINDFILIAHKGVYRYLTHVIGIEKNEVLAAGIWGRDANNKTWQHVYYLDKSHDIDISKDEMNRLIGYQENFILRGFIKVADKHIENIIETYGSTDEFISRAILHSEPYHPQLEQIESIDGLEQDYQTRENNLWNLPIDRLLRRIKDITLQPSHKKASTTFYERSPIISVLAKRRADGVCQLCDRTAPFAKNGIPYLETHHIIWLSNGGEDTLENTVALCPNCHRKMHMLDLKQDIDKLLRRASKHV